MTSGTCLGVGRNQHVRCRANMAHIRQSRPWLSGKKSFNPLNMLALGSEAAPREHIVVEECDRPLSSKYGLFKTVKAWFWSWCAGKSQ